MIFRDKEILNRIQKLEEEIVRLDIALNSFTASTELFRDTVDRLNSNNLEEKKKNKERKHG